MPTVPLDVQTPRIAMPWHELLVSEHLKVLHGTTIEGLTISESSQGASSFYSYIKCALTSSLVIHN